MINLPTKFEVPSFARYRNIYMKGVAKRRKWGGLGLLLLVMGHPRSLKIASFDRAHTTSLIEAIAYLVPFVRYSLSYVQHRCILIPLLLLTPPMEGFPWDDLRKILHGG